MNDLEKELLLDFHDSKYINSSLIDIYMKDYKYFVALRKQGKISKNAVKILEYTYYHEKIKMVYENISEQCTYEEIIAEFMSDAQIEHDQNKSIETPKIIENEYNQKSDEKTKDKTVLSEKDIDIHNNHVESSENAAKHIIYSPHIDKILKGTNHSNSFGSYQMFSHLNEMCFECQMKENIPVYVLKPGEKLTGICSQCGKDNKKLFRLTKRNKKEFLGEKCTICGKNYVLFDTFMSLKSKLIAENSSDITTFVKQAEAVDLIRQERKQEKKNIRNASLLGEARRQKQSRKNSSTPKKNKLYLLCEVKDTTSGQCASIIVADKYYNSPAPNTFVVTNQDLLGNACLDAIANGKDFFEKDGRTYKIWNQTIYHEEYLFPYMDQKQKRDSNHIIKTYSHVSKTENYHDSPEKTVYVYFRLTNTCVTQAHPIETVTMQVKDSITSAMLKVNVYHCKKCDRYFVNHEMLAGFIKRNQHPAFHYCVVRDDSLMLSPMSELMMYGYNVKEGELTDRERQRILRFLIDTKLMTKHDIIRSLQFKVEFNGKKSSNANAKVKWEDDIRFVSQYGTVGQKTINGKLVRGR